MAAFPRGRFCWHELMTTDVEAAKRFYTKVAGWKMEAWPADPSYTLLMNGKNPVGGLMKLPDEAKAGGAPPNWMPYVAVADARDLVRQVTDFGGKLMNGPKTIPMVGTFAILQDPQGAAFAVLQPETEAPGHDGAPKLGEFSWHELATTDPQAAWNFYEMLFGWEKMDSMDMGPGGSYDMFGRGGQMLGGMYAKPADMPAPPNWLCYAKVPSADKGALLVKELGGRILNGPMEVPGGDRIVQCMDPQGVMFAIHSAAARAPAAPKPKTAKKKTSKKKAAAKKTKKKKTTKKKATRTAKKAKKGKRKAVKRKATKKKATRKKTTKKKSPKRKTVKKKTTRKKATKRKAVRTKKGARKKGKRKAAKKRAAKKQRSRRKR